MVDEATHLARITAEDPNAGLPVRATLIQNVPDLDLSDPSGHQPPEEKIEIARRAEAEALRADPRITNSEGAEYWDRTGRYVYATASGFAAGYATSSFGISVVPVASQNGEMQRDGWHSMARRRERLDSPEAVGRIAAQRPFVDWAPARSRPSRSRRLRAGDGGQLIRSPASAASGPSLYRRASFLCDRLGSRVAAPGVTVVDDGMMPGALGSRPFDGEGLPTRRTVVVGDGVLESYLLDTYSGHKLGMASTHHAARDGSGVTVGTTNLMLLPGPATPEEIIGSVRNGLYVTELIGFGVNGRPATHRGAAGL